MSKTETTFTPGPWDDASNYPKFHSVRIFAGTHYIATVGNSDDAKKQTEANARLIAAAAELLAMCKLIMAEWESDVHSTQCFDSRIITGTRLAIQKAEGRA